MSRRWVRIYTTEPARDRAAARLRRAKRIVREFNVSGGFDCYGLESCLPISRRRVRKRL